MTHPIGPTIRRLRRAHVPEMSQWQLAEACGIGQPAVCAIEKGRCAPSWATLSLMSAALGMPMSAVVAAWEADAPQVVARVA